MDTQPESEPKDGKGKITEEEHRKGLDGNASSSRLADERVADNMKGDNEAQLGSEPSSPSHNGDVTIARLLGNKSVAFVTDDGAKNDALGADTSNKFQILPSCEDVEGLEVRFEGNYEEDEIDGVTSKFDGELSKKKQDRKNKNVIPPSDRLTRSVAKKTDSKTSS